MVRILTLLLIILAATGGYLFFAAYRCARLFVTGKLRAAAAALLGLCLILSVPYLLFGRAIAIAIVALHLALFLFLGQVVHFIVNRAFHRSDLRDRLHRSGLLPMLCVTALLVYGSCNMTNIARTEYTVGTDKRIPDGGYTLALLSDVHFGMSLDEGSLLSVVERINREDVDVAVLCGDIVDEGTTREEIRTAFQTLGKLKARHGIYYVYGNHDRSMRRNRAHDLDAELDAAIRDAGITILRDQLAAPADGLVLAGREDRSRPRLSASALIREANSDSFIVMLDHQPTDFGEKSAAGVDLQLSGHTHAGQFFPIGYINTLISENELCYGSAQIGEMTAIVTSGASGWGVPLRTQARSEYVIVHVEKE